MAQRPQNILLFGATGVIGQFIIRELVNAKSSFNRIAIFTSPTTLTRKSDEIQALKDSGVEVIAGDIGNDDDVLAAYKGIDAVIAAVGRNIITKQIDLIKLAERSLSVKRFFPSEFGTDIEYFPTSKDEKPHQLKLEVRRFFNEHVKRLEHTYIVTGPYPELYVGAMPDHPNAGTFEVKSKTAVIIGSGNERIGFTTMPDVGRFVVAALQHPAVTRNRAIKVQSFTATPNELVKEFERQMGSHWNTSLVSLQQYRHYEEEAWSKANPIAGIYTLRRIWSEGGTLYDTLDNVSIGISTTDTMQSVVQKAIEEGGGAGFRSGEM